MIVDNQPAANVTLSVSDQLRTLNDRECKVLRMTYGIGQTYETKSTRQIARHIGVSEDFVLKIKKKATRKIVNSESKF